MKNNLNTIKKNLLLFLLVGIIITVIGFGSNLINKVHAIENGSKDSFITDQSALDRDQITYETENKYVSISNFYNESTQVISGAPNDDQVISICTSRELYLFSYLCFNEERFLSYDYELLANIEYGLEEYFIPIGYMASSEASTPTAFTGSFNGNGFEINQLRYIILNDEMFNSGIYATKKLTTFSMFAYNSGTIENFGLIEPELLQNYTIETIQYISPLVGNNTGTVSNIYLIDLRDPVNDGGIYANDYNISGFVSTNSGTIENCYVAYSSVLNYAVFNYISFVPLVYNGTVTNCYFYDESIESFTDGVYTYNQYLGYRATKNLLGTYASSAKVIRSGLLNSDGWFSKDSYLISAIDDEYPIRKGLIAHDLDETDNDLGVDAAFAINNEFELAYVYQLANDNSYFFSNKISYYITNNLDFNLLPNDLFVYDDFIDSRFVGVASSNFSVALLNGDISNYPTIYNPYLDNYIEYAGSVYYGMFPLFDGRIENLNIVSKNVSDNFISHNNTEAYKVIGIVSGLIEGGTINNVNVLGNISLSNNTFGNYYCGLLAGVVGRGTTINNVTTCGNINGGTHDGTTYDAQVGYVTGNSMGGVVGYTLNNVGNISNVLSEVSLTATNFTSANNINQYIGGIIGSGYIAKLYHATNHGNIIIASTYSNINAAGIVGSLFGASNIVEGVHNQGDITVTINTLKTIHISGVMNVDFVMTNTNTLMQSSLDTFYGAGISNGSDINVTNNVTLSSSNAASLSNITITGVLFVNASNGFKSEIKGLYNLGYKYNGSTKEHFDTNVTIDISLLDSYAPCIESTATSETGAMIIDTVYNFRNVDYVTNQDIYFDNVKYSGCILGQYMTLSSIYNEGNLDFNISKDASNTLSLGNNLYKKFIVVGVFEEVSQGHSANIIYNDGDINFYLTQNVNDFYFNLFLSGICYANRSSAINDSDYDIYRLESNKYDKNAIGSLNQAINNGKIESTSYAIENSIYGSFEVVSANGQVVTGIKWYSAPYGSDTISFDTDGNVTSNINTNGLLKGMSNISGVCAINEYVITNTFNLGNVFNANYIVEPSGDYAYPYGFEVNSGGLTYANIGEYAQIKDSANNGVIKAINFSSSSNSSANAAGISVRNDVLETGADYTSGGNHSKQTICFTINYGEVYSYNYCDNVGSIEQEQHAKSAGIMALGLCSIVNTVNYGNIYGSEVSSGIFGLVYFEKVATEVDSSNKVIFANSINYGNIWGINKGANSYLTQNQGNTKKDNQTYQELYVMSFSNQTDYASIDLVGEAKDARLGALIGVSNLNNSADAQYISIRYLINFCNTIPLVGGEYGIASSINPNVDTMVSTYSKIENGLTTYDKFMGKTVTYGPLSSEIAVINGVQYPGVFNRNFQFRLAVEGEIPPVETTDNYINDFFGFVGFTKINDSLLEKIGWRTIAYTTASIEFTRDLEAMENLMRMYKDASSTGYAQLVENALNTSSWIGNADPNVLPNLVQSILEGKDYVALQDLIKYLFMTADNKNAITNEMRESVIEELIVHLNTTDTPKEYLEAILFGDGSSYSEILSEVISTNDLEKEVIKQFILDQLNDLSDDELESIARDYIILLNNNSFDSYINDSSLIEARINVLKVLTNNVDDEILLNLTQHLEVVSTEYEIIVKMKLAYDQFTTEERRELFLNILANNTDIDNFYTVINAVSEEINYYEKINEINKTNFVNDDDFSNANNYLEIWNLIRNSDYFRDYLDTILPTITDINGNSEKGIYGIATEARNTFQSLDKPAYDGRNVLNFDNGNNESLIFNYEPTISPNTYFYGPFRNINSSHTVAYEFDDSTYGVTLPNGYSYTPSFTNIGSQSGADAYVPTFTTTDSNYIIDILGDTSPVAFYYDKNEQFVSESYFNAFSTTSSTGLLQDFSGTNLIPGNVITVSSTDKGTVTGTTVDGDTISGYKGSTSSGTWTVTIGKVSCSISGTPTQYANFVKTYAIKYYMSAKAQVGIIRFYNPYSDFSASYFTAKGGGSYGGIEGYVYTTQYIDYTSTDLAKLDGILTGYAETTVQSQDEIDLINFVCNNYLFSSSNKSKTVKIIKKILLETLQNDSSTIDKFFDELINNNENIVNSQPMKDYLVVDSSNTTLKDYLFASYPDTSKNNVVLLGSTNLGNFKYIIDYLLNDSEGYYAYLHGQYDAFEEVLQTFEPQYILDLINYATSVGGLTFDEALEAVNQLTASDIESLLNNYPSFSADLTTIISSVGTNFPANYTFSNTWVSSYSPQVIDGVSYTFGALANDATTTNNTITFTASKSGTILIVSNNCSEITINGNTGTSINTNVYSWDVVASASYTIRCSQGVVIYNIKEPIEGEKLNTNNSGTNITYDNTFSYQTGSQSITYYTTTNNNNRAKYVDYTGYLVVPAGGEITFTTPASGTYYLVFTANAASSSGTLRLNGNSISLSYLNGKKDLSSANTLTTTAQLYFYNTQLSSNTTYTLSFTTTTYIYAIGIGTKTGNDYTWTYNAIYSSTYAKRFDTLFASDIVSISPFKTSAFISYNNKFYGEDLPTIALNNLVAGNAVQVTAQGSGGTISLVNGTTTVSTVNLTSSMDTYTFTIPSDGDYTLEITGFVTYEDVVIIEHTDNNYSCPIEYYFSNEFESFMNQDNSSSIKGKELLEDYIIDSVFATDDINFEHLSINDLAETGTITSNIVNGVFTINANATSNVVISSTSTKYLNLVGSGSATNRNVQFDVSTDSYVIVKASGDSLVLSIGTNTYVKPISSTDNYHIYDVAASSQCYLYSNDSDCYIYDIYIVDKSLNATTLINKFNELYPDFPTTTGTITAFDGVDGDLYERYTVFEGTTRSDADYINDFKNLILFFSPATFDYASGSSLWDLFTDDELHELSIMLGVAFDEVLETYIYDDDTLSSLQKVIEILIIGDGRLTEDIFKYLSLDSSTLTDAQKDALTAIYVSTNFNVVMDNAENNAAITAKDSELYDIIRALPTEYCYYDADGNLINDKFEALMQELGYNLVTTGYGIYALASSHGIYNGAYIPDNITFNTVTYENDTEINSLTEINPYYQLNADNKYELSDQRSADWRSELIDGDELTSNTSSVNYGFKVAMKQLKKSIATTIFDLVLVDNAGNDYKLYTDTEYIILEVDDDDTLGSVTFYVPGNIGSSILSSTFVISSYEISDKATLNIDGKEFTVESVTPTTIRVVAEDTTVYKDYDVYIKKTGDVVITYDSYEVVTNDGTKNGTITDSTISDAVSYKDGNMIVNLTTKYVPKMTDLTKYLYLDGVLLSDTGLIEFNSIPYVGENSAGNWLNGDELTATLDMKISDELASGTHILTIKYSDDCKFDLTFTKSASPEKEIIKMIFDGEEVVFDANNEAITYIKMGRTFTEADLASINGIPLYLDNIVISPLATISTTATILLDNNVEETTVNGVTIYTNGILTYKVTYTITPEDGSSSSQYIHYLVEMDPFMDAKDSNGDFITGANYNRNDYAHIYENGKTTTHVPTTDGQFNIEFRRGNNPKYQASFNLEKFYTGSMMIEDYLSVNGLFNYNSFDSNDVYQINIKPSGFNVDFFDTADIGIYSFILQYATEANGISWNSTTKFQRVYNLPSLNIEKLESVDSYLKKVAFTREANKLFNLATVASLEKIIESSDDPSATNTYEYISALPESSRDVVSNTTYGIVYQTEAALNAKEYYIVGSVSDTMLEGYSPLFTIESHAKIYRYVMNGNQRLLYVEFIDANDNKQIFLVDESFNNVYLESDLNTSIGTLVDSKFTYNNTEYTVSNMSGTVSDSNSSLYADFVGNPEEGQLWYNDYIVYAENYVNDDSQYHLYHIAVIDITNSIYFTFVINDESTNRALANEYIYIRINGKEIVSGSDQAGDSFGEVGVFAYNTLETTETGANVYETKHTIQALQYGYYYFTIDLPDGLKATYTVQSNKANQSGLDDQSYLPPSSLVSQRITITITITDSNETDKPWGENLSSLYAKIVERG